MSPDANIWGIRAILIRYPLFVCICTDRWRDDHFWSILPLSLNLEICSGWHRHSVKGCANFRLCISIDSQRHTSASMGGLVCLKRYQSLIGPPAVVPVADWLSLPNLPYSHLLLSTKSRSVYSINGLRVWYGARSTLVWLNRIHEVANTIIWFEGLSHRSLMNWITRWRLSAFIDW